MALFILFNHLLLAYLIVGGIIVSVRDSRGQIKFCFSFKNYLEVLLTWPKLLLEKRCT